MSGDKVYLEKTCPAHGQYRTLLWQGSPAWQSWVRTKIPSKPPVCATEVDKGCPLDCGLCTEHRQHTCTALLEVTQRCNLNCSYCFASAGGNHVDPSLAMIEKWLESIYKASGACNLQLSGGEPTVRDDLPEIIALVRRIGFPFIQVNSNGLRLAEDAEYTKQLQKAGLNSVFLQFDGTEERIYRQLRGRNLLTEKIQAIKNCTGNGLGVVLVPTVVPGVNTDNIGAMIHFAIENSPGVRGIHFQPVSYFGRFPQVPADEDRVTLPQVMRAIEDQTEGLIKTEHLKPPGCENALCSFHGNFRILPNGKVKAYSTNSCCSVEKADVGASKNREFVARQWKGVSSDDPLKRANGGNSLQELNMGAWEGERFASIRAKYPEEFERRGEDLANYRPSGGESFIDLYERVIPVFQQIISRAQNDILLVSHAGVNRVILAHVLGLPLTHIFRFKQDYGCLNAISYDGKALFCVEKMNAF